MRMYDDDHLIVGAKKTAESVWECLIRCLLLFEILFRYKLKELDRRRTILVKYEDAQMILGM